MAGLNFPSIFGGGGIVDETGTFQSDWKAIVNQGSLIVKDSSHDGDTATVTLYTVPTGKKLYLFYSTMTSIARAAGAGGDSELQIDGEAILSFSGSNIDEAFRELSGSYAVPLELVGGTVIRSSNGGTTNQILKTTIGGYLI